MRFHDVTQTDKQIKTYRLFISGIFPFNVFEPWLTVGNEMMECGTWDGGWKGESYCVYLVL